MDFAVFFLYLQPDLAPTMRAAAEGKSGHTTQDVIPAIRTFLGCSEPEASGPVWVPGAPYIARVTDSPT